jgi:hypothetical protein
MFVAVFSLISVSLLKLTTPASAIPMFSSTAFDYNNNTTGSYLPYGDTYGVGWFDANKTYSNGDDDLMCWAAAAANILAWGNWNYAMPAFTTEDPIFQHYQDHWSDQGGLMEFGWSWWIDGINPSQYWNSPEDDADGWSQVDVPDGVPENGFWPQYSFYNYYYRTWQDDLAMSAIDNYLHSGYGTTIGIYGPGGHALTVWGYTYNDDTGAYEGIIFSDSDDYMSDDGSMRNLWWTNIDYNSGTEKWHLGGSDWYIGEVMALERNPIPEPCTILLFGLGIIGLGVYGFRRKRKA